MARMRKMRIALTLGRKASKDEKNDYIRALIHAGFRREEIVVLPPGAKPQGDFDGVVLGGGLLVAAMPYRYQILGREVGTYKVQLIVKDGDKASDAKQLDIEVK